ncbi:hypothetical protein B0H14DRAFT_3513626 [Mycena olivaceomarginata]|nr:hypothetical protein B0H14DRAFT_3513626 [Mycena olivaceomarginata]
MADLKYNNFMAQVKEMLDSTPIPVNKILVMDYQVNARVTNTTDNIKTVITNTGKTFASNNILDRLRAVIGAGLDMVFGDVTANQAECTTYAITCEDLGGIMHIDIKTFCYTFCYTFLLTPLTQVTNSVISIVYMISSIVQVC